MQRSKLLASTAIALLMSSVPALAQQKSDDKAGAAQTQGSETKERSETKEQGASPKGTSKKESREQGESKEKGAQRTEKESKGTAQAPSIWADARLIVSAWSSPQPDRATTTRNSPECSCNSRT